jgi:hypothetical protein
MITQGTKKKQNQAEVAQEKQIDILTTSDTTRTIKDGVLNPLVNLFMELDYQYRDFDVTVYEYGEMGIQANLERFPPSQLRNSTIFYWIGDELIKGVQEVQQKISTFNVLMQLPPQLMPHFQLDLEPVLIDIFETVYGSRISRQALKDTRSLISVDPEKENQLMMMGHYVMVHPMDDAQKHIAAHKQAIETQGDVSKLIESHIMDHMVVLNQKMQQQQQAGQEQQPQPGGPRPGAKAAAPRPVQHPPGTIHKDQMTSQMPRKF